MANELVPYSDMEKMAQAIARSGLFGIKTPDQAIALMVIAQAEGLHPGIVARDYHIIQGRPSLKADAMLARFQASGGKVEWETLTDTKAAAIFTHPSSPKPVLIDWTIERAASIKTWSQDKNREVALTEKENWRNYPRQMLRSRVVSEGVRTTYPAATVGIYTPEEVMDMSPDRKPEAIEGQYHEAPQQRTPDPRGPEYEGKPIATQPPLVEQQPLPVDPPRQQPPETIGSMPSGPAQRVPGARYNARNIRVITDAQMNLAIDKATAGGVRPEVIQAAFNVSTIADIPYDQMNNLLTFISRNSTYENGGQIRY